MGSNGMDDGPGALNAMANEVMELRAENARQAEEIARLASERDALIDAAKDAIPESEHPAEPTPHYWSWQIRQLGEDRRSAYRLWNEKKRESDIFRDEIEEQKTVLIHQRERAEKAEAESARLRAELSEVRSELTRTSVKLEDHRKQYAAMLRRRVENEEQWEAWMNEQVGGDALKGGGR